MINAEKEIHNINLKKLIIDENLNDFDIAIVALHQFYDRHHGHVSCYGKRLAMNSDPHETSCFMVATAIDEEGNMYKISFPITDHTEREYDPIVDWENYEVKGINKTEWDILNGTN